MYNKSLMRKEQNIIRISILLIAALLSVYSLKFMGIIFKELHIELFHLDSKYYKAPYNLFIYASLIMAFLLSFLFRKEANLAKKSMLAAFFISLLVEMYGFGFSLYFLYILLGKTKVLEPYIHYPNPHTFFHHTIRLPVLVLTWTAGLFLISKGWKRVWQAKGNLATLGIYRYMRHPQYLGFILILAGGLFFFPTPLLFLLFIFLTTAYYRLSRIEERKLVERFGDEYLEYMKKVPMW